MTSHQLDRLRVLADPASYVASLCESDREAVRAAIEEVERLREELNSKETRREMRWFERILRDFA
jgi:hypothetical protein